MHCAVVRPRQVLSPALLILSLRPSAPLCALCAVRCALAAGTRVCRAGVGERESMQRPREAVVAEKDGEKEKEEEKKEEKREEKEEEEEEEEKEKEEEEGEASGDGRMGGAKKRKLEDGDAPHTSAATAGTTQVVLSSGSSPVV